MATKPKSKKNKEGLFIVFEGIDGCGKSTQAEHVAEWLEHTTGKKTIRTAEPFIFRDLILNHKELTPQSELLLFLADRTEHAAQLISPAIAAGHNVICERYTYSTIAYQSGGRKLDFDHVVDMIETCYFLRPSITFLFDLKPETAYERVRGRRNGIDRFEAQNIDFFKRVATCYKRIFKYFDEDTDIIIDCNKLIEAEVFSEIISYLEELI